MSDNQNQSQGGRDTDGRSPEYRDEMTKQDVQKVSEVGSTGASSMGGGAVASGTMGGGTTPGGIGGGTGLGGSTTLSGTTGGAIGAGAMGSGASAGSTIGGSTVGGGTTSSGGTTDMDRGSTHREMGDNTDGMGRDQTDRVTADETGTLISADKVQGTAVYDGTGERLGTIDSLMLNKRSGKVAYAVMSFGGFLGIGERYHPLPWDKLTYDTDKGGYNIGVTQDELRSGPTYSRDELDSVGDRSRSGEIDDYYGRSATSTYGAGNMAASGAGIV